MAGRIAAVVTIASCRGQSAPRGKGEEQGVDILFGVEEMLLGEGGVSPPHARRDLESPIYPRYPW